MGGLTQEQLDWSLKNKIKSLPGVEAIAVERRRQVIVEGWTPEHDDEHKGGEMRVAAACYAGDMRVFDRASPPQWPWDETWWKPKGTRENLVRAGALIAAEIDRLDRLENK